VEYLKERAEDKIAAPEVYLDDAGTRGLNTLREAQAAVGAIEIEFSKRLVARWEIADLHGIRGGWGEISSVVTFPHGFDRSAGYGSTQSGV